MEFFNVFGQAGVFYSFYSVVYEIRQNFIYPEGNGSASVAVKSRKKCKYIISSNIKEQI